MKTFKSILLTILCGSAILLAGYTGIIFGGEWVLTNPTEPERITMKGNVSSLFYSRLDDDIQLYPWNYYPQNAQVRNFSEEETEEYFFLAFNPLLERDVFYVLISIAADVRYEEVSQWYEQQQKTILDSMVQGEVDDKKLPLYFYEDVLTLRGTEYEVRISCEQIRITSFSCVPCRDAGIKETEEWKEKQERLTEQLEQNSAEALQVYEAMYDLYYTVDIASDWDMYLAVYSDYIRAFVEQVSAADQRNAEEDIHSDHEENIHSDHEEDIHSDHDEDIHSDHGNEAAGNYNAEKASAITMSEENKKVYYEELGITDMVGTEELELLNSMQIIELPDSILLVLESQLTVGLYYDVLEQRIVGFHFLNNYLRL